MLASHPAAMHPFPAHAAGGWDHDEHAAGSSAAFSSNVQLPRTLARPPFAEINRAHVAAIAPELGDVPPEYVRRGLKHKAPQMLAGLSALSTDHLPPSISRAQLAQTPALSIPIRPSSSSSYPTHILAVQSKTPGPSDQVPLIPTHSLVLAAHCAHLPRLPPPAPEPSGRTPTLALPVLPLSVPAPAALPALHAFLYTHRADALAAALLPGLPPAFLSALSASPAQTLKETLASGAALHQLSVAVLNASAGQLAALMGLTKRCTGVWKNAVSLGVFESELWDTLDLVWEVLLGALNLAAGAK